ncbi:solute:sodium symporter family transporter [Vibrio sp. MA40-2]|uniref:solute:sodium symporter family transporter n=1 Tax=Vibrio sp. MA40-2 TaxID=3391828 RepID=UPI0039A49A32
MIAMVSFISFTLLVAWISYKATKEENLNQTTGYFLAGRSLPWFVIAGSLFLTNISAEQLTGLNGNAFMNGANVMAWETVAAVTMIVLAVVFLPRFLKGGVATVPQFLELRYGKRMRSVASFIFIYAIVIGFLPFVLYAGAITLGKLFAVSDILGVSENAATWIMVISLGITGGIYAVFGGLKAVAVSDTVNGVGLLFGGFLVPILALYQLGDSSIADGFNIVISESPERMAAAGIGEGASVPWHTLFSGILLINLFYWCTNQAIVQRSLGAKNLAEGQKGVLAAAMMKVFGVAMLVLPGIIAWHMHQKGMITVPTQGITDAGEVILAKDMAYPTLVREVMPSWLTGFFGAVLFGAVMSSFNSGVNSISTLVSLDIYKQIINPTADDLSVVRIGKIFGSVTIAICVCIAPWIAQSDGLYTLMRTIMAVINVPILTVVLVGVVSKRTPALSAYIALPIGMLTFFIANFVLKNDFGWFQLHWLHTVGLNFLWMVAIMMLVRYIKPMDTPYQQKATDEVEVQPWKHATTASWTIIAMLAVLYTVFSNIGILGSQGSVIKVAAVLISVAAICYGIHRLIQRKTQQNVIAEKLT